MRAAKTTMLELIQRQPDDSSYEELLRELMFEHAIQQGLEDVRQGRVISNGDMREEIESWSN
jgi:hypothetical protein